MAQKAFNSPPNFRMSEQRRLPELLRASLHYYNSEEEVGYFLEELGKLLRAG